MNEDIRSLGLKDMHPMQVQALMDLIGYALKLAADTDDTSLINETEAMCDELVRLFGGVGVQMTMEADPNLPEDGWQSLH